MRITKYFEAEVEKTLTYLEEKDIKSVSISETWRTKLDGYGKIKHPLKYMIKLNNNRSYRVYYCCYSNSGTAYIIFNKKWAIVDFELKLAQ